MTYVEDVIASHVATGVVLDTNVLVLLVVGAVDEKMVGKAKRTQHYSPKDYAVLVGLLELFQEVRTTPNILTEANNLVRQSLKGELGAQGAEIFRRLAQGMLAESYFPSETAVESAAHAEFGLADSATFELCQEHNFLLLTDDGPLTGYCKGKGVAVLTFWDVQQLPL